MMTGEQIKQLITEELEYAQKQKSELWERSIAPNSNPNDVLRCHMVMGKVVACETLLCLIEETENYGQNQQ